MLYYVQDNIHMYILYCINEEVVVYLKVTINNCGCKFYHFGRLMDLVGINFRDFLSYYKDSNTTRSQL